MVALKQDISAVLDEVIDPHFKVGLNDMGMVTDIVSQDNGEVVVGMRSPCIGCPAWTMMQHQVKSKVATIRGVNSVKIKIDWEHPWTREDMSQTAREKAKTHGYLI